MDSLHTTIVIKFTRANEFNYANNMLYNFVNSERDLANEFNLSKISNDTWQYQYDDIYDEQNSDYKDRLVSFEDILFDFIDKKGIKYELQMK